MDIKILICLLLVHFGSSLCSQSGGKDGNERAFGSPSKAPGSTPVASAERSNLLTRTEPTTGRNSRQSSIKNSEELAKSVCNLKIKEEGKEPKEKAKEDKRPPWKELADLLKRRTPAELERQKDKFALKKKWESRQPASDQMADLINECKLEDLPTEDGHKITFQFLPYPRFDDTKTFTCAFMLEEHGSQEEKKINMDESHLFLLAKAQDTEGEEQIVGFAKLRFDSEVLSNEVFVEVVYVEKEFQRYNISQRLVEFIVNATQELKKNHKLKGTMVYAKNIDRKKNPDEMKAFVENGFKPSKPPTKIVKVFEAEKNSDKHSIDWLN